MAVIKHIANKNSNYGESERYLIFQHNEYTQKPILDEEGHMILREEYYLDGLNCDPFSFASECQELNSYYHKNKNFNEIKSHHYIISFDPKDRDECGLTGERAQQLGLTFAKKNFPGHQALVCTHTDGHNESGNIHVHIVINSLRKYDIPQKPYMAQTVAYIQEHGYDSLDDFHATLDQASDQTSASRKSLKDTEQQLKDMNEQIHFTGQYLAYKNVYADYRKSRNKEKFYEEHQAELSLYDTALRTLKEKSGGNKLPSMKALYAEKDRLVELRNRQREDFFNHRDYERELRTVSANIDMILKKNYEQLHDRKEPNL